MTINSIINLRTNFMTDQFGYKDILLTHESVPYRVNFENLY
jgi:hypothetical protein